MADCFSFLCLPLHKFIKKSSPLNTNIPETSRGHAKDDDDLLTSAQTTQSSHERDDNDLSTPAQTIHEQDHDNLLGLAQTIQTSSLAIDEDDGDLLTPAQAIQSSHEQEDDDLLTVAQTIQTSSLAIHEEDDDLSTLAETIQTRSLDIDEAIQTRSLDIDEDDGDLFSNLHEDVILNILTRLSTKDLVVLMQVSKSLKAVISQPYFVNNLHILSNSINANAIDQYHHHLVVLEHTSDHPYGYRFQVCYRNSATTCFSLRKSVQIPFQPRVSYGLFKVEGSTQGVVCFSEFRDLYLWNPLIGKLIRLPCVQPTCSSDPVMTLYGFGFDPVNVDFKVVKILYYDRECIDRTEAFVYAHKTESWTSIGSSMVPCYPYLDGDWISDDIYNSNVCVSGVVNWLAYHKQPTSRDPYEYPSDCMMGFDLVKHVFKVVKLPESILTMIADGTLARVLRLSTTLNGKSLAVCVKHYLSGYTHISMFVFCDANAGEGISWETKFSIRVSQVYHSPQVLVSSREFLSVLIGQHPEKSVLVDVENGEVTKDHNEHLLPPYTTIIPYHPSLALLKPSLII